eukprot:tig00001056_g6640.t1
MHLPAEPRRDEEAGAGPTAPGGPGVVLTAPLGIESPEERPPPRVESASSARTSLDTDREKELVDGVPVPPEQQHSNPTSTYHIFLIGVVYFVQGALVVANLSMQYFLKDDLNLSPVEATAVIAAAAFPWAIKPLWGFASDSFPICGYRRRPYLFFSGLLTMFGWHAMAALVYNPAGATACLIAASMGIAIGDVLVDSIVVEWIQGGTAAYAAHLQSVCYIAKACGEILSGFFGGFALEFVPKRVIFAAAGACAILVSAVAILLGEQPVHRRRPAPGAPAPPRSAAAHFKQQVALLKEAVLRKEFLYPVGAIFLLGAMPSCGSSMFYYLTNELKFPPRVLGYVNLSRSIAHLAGVALYRRFFYRHSFVRIVVGGVVVGTAMRLTQLLLVTRANLALGIPDEVFVVGDSAILAAVMQFCALPLMAACALLCPPGVEGSVFALIMSCNKLAHMLSDYLGAGLTWALGITRTDFTHLWALLLICHLSHLLPLPLFFFAGFPDVSASIAAEKAPPNTPLGARKGQEMVQNAAVPEFERGGQQPV